MSKFRDMLYDNLTGLFDSGMDACEVEEKGLGIYHALKVIFPEESVEFEDVYREVLEAHNVWMGDISILEDGTDHEEWLADQKAELKWSYWKRYAQYLKTIEKLPSSVVESMDETTDAVLGRIESPHRPGAWDRRGMVVGSVQAGKTGNYTGVICKAVDAGYKVIIVLAGLNNDLRSQTQKRLDLGFLGIDTSKKDNHDQSTFRIGAGTLSKFKPSFPVQAITSSLSNGDFTKKIRDTVTLTPGGDPIIVVVKKNTTPLKNLFDCFSKQNPSGKLHDIPLLLIDDEADNASIDTKASNRMALSQDEKEKDPTKINGYIRKILNTFTQSAYIGYTATPFANIFIYPDIWENHKEEYGEDLFPRSFIVNLPTPSNYLGAERLFGLKPDSYAGIEKELEPLDLVRPINDVEPYFPIRHKSTLIVKDLPASMKKAVLAFVLGSAVRHVRQTGNKHHSMLVHVTRFVDVQRQVKSLLAVYLKQLRGQFEFRTGPQYEATYEMLKHLWEEDFQPTHFSVIQQDNDKTLTTVSWEQVDAMLFKTLSKIEVKAINGEAADGGLNYDEYPNGCSVIAVGGDKLSRGLTLEGLSVSYYTRNTNMYDALMQMGRWFGYRRGYLDLCRLYTTNDLICAYRHITVADHELRRELDNMAEMNATPKEYGLKVRTDPDGALIVTARNKMRNSEEQSVTFDGKLLQVTQYPRGSAVNAENVEKAQEWISGLENIDDIGRALISRNVSPKNICEFIDSINIRTMSFNPQTLISYIKSQNAEDELVDWTVAVITPSSTASNMHIELKGEQYGLSWRTDSTPTFNYISIGNNQLIKESDESLDLTEEEITRAYDLTKIHFVPTKKRTECPKKASPVWIRNVRDSRKGLLLIYFIDSGTRTNSEVNSYGEIYVGYAISFPTSRNPKSVKYKVDKVYLDMLQNELGLSDF